MKRQKQKTEPEEVGKLEDVVDMCNDLDVIETMSETVPEPTEVNNYDAMLPRNASRYVMPLR
jgi:hypothetical protein